VFVLTGPPPARLDAVALALAKDVGGEYISLADLEALSDLKEGRPLYGRELTARLTDDVLRQFLLRRIRATTSSLLAVHIPVMFWGVMRDTDVIAPARFLEGLREWPSPIPLVISYSSGLQEHEPAGDELRSLLSERIVEVTLSDAERLSLELLEEEAR
jgi:hypothetical protein